jgi:hypothetical protein
MKKRKLNSTNPKYMKKQETTTKVTRELICEAPTRTINGKLTQHSRKAKIYSIRYE